MILVSIRYTGAEFPHTIGPSPDTTLADVRSMALYAFGLSEHAGKGLKLFANTVELADLTKTVGGLASATRLLKLDLGTAPNAEPWNPRFEMTTKHLEQIMRIEADAAELRSHAQRAGVDVNITQLVGKLDESATRKMTKGSVEVVEECYVVDEAKESAAMQVLRELPEGAGNEAFLMAYKARLTAH